MRSNPAFSAPSPEYTFAYYGLDPGKNMLEAPTCACGCGEKCNLILEDKEDVNGFLWSILDSMDCDHCAAFAVSPIDPSRNRMAFKMWIDEDDEEPEIRIYGFKMRDDGAVEFGGLDDYFDFHQYGLIVEKEPGTWKIVED